MSIPEFNSKEEAEAWEKEQDNATDIYKVAGRIKNLSGKALNANLSPVGERLCNMFTHHVMALYAFADQIKDAKTKEAYLKLVRASEEMPAKFLATTVPPKKEEKNGKV